MSWPEWLEFDALAAAPELTTPTLVVHTEQGAIPDGAKQFVAAMPNPTQIDWMAGTQFHFYDDPATIDLAVTKVVAHLDSTFGAP
jgi:hypothetical protein